MQRDMDIGINTDEEGIFNIQVKTMNGNFYQLKVSACSKVSSLQGQIEQKTGVPIGAQRLLYKAVLLEPLKELRDYGILESNSIIKLVANRIPSEISGPSELHHSEVVRTNALTQQNLQYKKHRYLQQRMNGFTIENICDVAEALRQNKETIERMTDCLNLNKEEEENDYGKMPFVLDKRQLSVGDWVDVREVSGSWVEAQILKKYSNFVQVHYNGMPEHWNQWIAQSSERIMPFKSQTVTSEKSPLLSPMPMNPPLIKNLKGTSKSSTKKIIKEVISELPETLEKIMILLNRIRSPEQRREFEKRWKRRKQSGSKRNHEESEEGNEGDFEEEEEEENISFKNNRSHHSPPQSIQEEEYEYDIDMLEEGQDNVGGLENSNMHILGNKDSRSIKGGTTKKLMANHSRSSKWMDGKNRVVNYSRMVNSRMNTVTNGGMRTTSIIRHMNHNVSSSVSNRDNNTSSNLTINDKEEEYKPAQKAESEIGMVLGSNGNNPWMFSSYSNKTKSEYEHEQYGDVDMDMIAQEDEGQSDIIDDSISRKGNSGYHYKKKEEIIYDSSNQDPELKQQEILRPIEIKTKGQVHDCEKGMEDDKGMEEKEDKISIKGVNGGDSAKLDEIKEFHKKLLHAQSECYHHPSSEKEFNLIQEEHSSNSKEDEAEKKPNIQTGDSKNLAHSNSGKKTQLYSSSNMLLTPVQHGENVQADNLSNKCEQNLSNKGEGEQEDDISAKSFGSKRSERFMDASSMKSLIIDSHHEHANKSQEKNNNQRRNILKMDQVEVQSVTSAKAHHTNVKNSRFGSQQKNQQYYYYNQEDILEEEDSINGEDNTVNNLNGNDDETLNQDASREQDKISQGKHMKKPKDRPRKSSRYHEEEDKKMIFTQLAPLCDRLGRLLVDLAPHLAIEGYTQYSESCQYNENLSTFTNEGSLQSRMRNLSIRPHPNVMRQEEEEEVVVHKGKENSSSSSGKAVVNCNKSNTSYSNLINGQSKYCNFQVPVMLTPWEIVRINRLLQQEMHEEMGSGQQQQ